MPNPTAVRAAIDVAQAHGHAVTRCDILQDGATLVLRLSETLVARVVQDSSGPRLGGEWFARENAIALHLTRCAAPVIPLHGELPPGPHELLGFTMSFWEFVTRIADAPQPEQIGRALQQCHGAMRSFAEPMPTLAILHESLGLLGTLSERALLAADVIAMLERQLQEGVVQLATAPAQPLHGDAHVGNVMQTTRGLLWTDWEDTFAGPTEWDISSILWNARYLDNDLRWAAAVLAGYCDAGGSVDEELLVHCDTARAAVITAWYPLLYPAANAERQRKLQQRIEWLRAR